MPSQVKLHPEVLAYLERSAGGKSRAEMTVGETREAMRNLRRHQHALLQPVHVVDAIADGVPVRLYGAPSPYAMLYFHGGRFFSGDLDTHDLLCRELAYHSGCHICAVDYRLAPEYPYPAALEDAIRAARWLDVHADRMVVGGDSAGAGLAAALAISGEAPPLLWQMLIYPMLDATCASHSYREFAAGPGPSGEDMRRGWDLYLPENANRCDPRISPLHAPDFALFPSTYLVLPEADPLRDEGLAFAVKLRQAGVAVEVEDVPGHTHGYFPLTAAFTAARDGVVQAAHKLRQHLLPRPAAH